MSCQLNNVPAFIPKCEDIEKYTGFISKPIAPFHYIEGEKCVYCSYEKKIEKLQEQNKIMRDALESISKNGCCKPCQEAKLVAKSALEKVEE